MYVGYMNDFNKINEELKNTNTEYYTETIGEDHTNKLVLKAVSNEHR